MSFPKNLPAALTKVIYILCALLLTPSAAARDMVSVNRPVINMRTGPGTGATVLWAVAQGYPLEVTQRKGQWLKVRDFENDTGWVYRPLLNKSPHVIVRSSVANIRSTPNTRGRIMGKASYGEIMRTLERRHNWVRVQRQSGNQGWIFGKLVWGW